MAELRFEHTDVGYGQRVLISDVCLQLEKGEIVALTGPNGAGKSTILKTAAGLLKPISGKVYLKEEDLAGMRLSRRAKELSVMLTERVRTEYMSCYDVMRTGRYQYSDFFGGLSETDREVIGRTMELTQTTELKDEDFSRLSDGQKQRVLLAKAIVSEPSVLLLDEPTSFLDIGYRTTFFDILKMLAKEKGVAVLISMHEIELVGKLADRVVCITKDRRIDKCGKPAEILTPAYTEELFSMPKGKYEEYYGA